MAVREEQRQAYLQELGIQTYFPRRALPGAKPSPRYVSGDLTALEPKGLAVEANVERLSALIGKPPAALAHADSEQAQARIELQAALARKSPEPQANAAAVAASAAVVPAAARTQAPVATPAPAPAEEDTRFSFAYFPINEDLAVINELPWAKSAAVSPACRQLLAAILKALSVPCEERALTSMVFTWPLSEDPDFDRSAQSARHTLDGFLARRFKLRPVRYLLVLAEQSAEYLFPMHFDWQQEGMKRHPHHAVDVIVTRSLNAMDAVPDIKRSVWQALQPLRAALANPGIDSNSSVNNGQ